VLFEYEVALLKAKASGFGGFADCWEGVFLGRYKVAMKAPRDRFAGEVGTRRLAREINVWSQLNHPNVLSFIGSCILGSISYLISPWMENGHVLEFVQRNPEADCLRLLAQVVQGLKYLHTFKPQVIHGDLRGPNILVSLSGDACIADFGLSELKAEGYDPNYSTPWVLAGHPRWQAPEIIKAETKEEAWRNTATDIFAFGRVMLELFTKQVPFSEIRQDTAVTYRVWNGEFPKRPQDDEIVARGLDDTMWGLMMDCWNVAPEQRPSATDIVSRLTAALETRSERESSSRPAKRARISNGLAE